jgi:hypothetical protein
VCDLNAWREQHCPHCTLHPATPQHFDGASRGNPGYSGAGAHIRDNRTGHTVAEVSRPLRYGTTSNEAEYTGLIEGLRVGTCGHGGGRLCDCCFSAHY